MSTANTPGGAQPSDREQADADNAAAVAARDAARDQAVIDLGVTNDRIDALIAASERQSQTNEDLAIATVEYQERARLARRRFRVTIIAIALTALLILSGIFVLFARITTTLDNGAKTRDTLIDCVRPAGKCYQRGQARTAELVGTLNKVTTLAAACAPDYVALPMPERVVAIEKCIRRGLK